MGEIVQRPPWRVCGYRVDLSVLLSLFKNMQCGEYVTAAGLPFDARLVGVYHDFMMNSWVLHIESDTFDAVPEATIPPERHIEFTLNGIPTEG